VNLLDTAVDWIQWALSVLPVEAREFLWLPLLVIMVFIALVLVIRKALPLVGRVGTTALRWAVVVLGAALLLPEVAVATIFRRRQTRPPGLVYGYGDAVATSVIGLVKAAGSMTTAFTRVSQVNILVVMLSCGGLMWMWNQNHCGGTDPADACVRPVTRWIDNLG
jgi:hypothetical protein